MTRLPRSRLDLDDVSRRALEFDDLLAWVASFAETAMGAERVTATVPSSDEATVRQRLVVVDEVRRCLEVGGSLVPARLPDPRGAVESLRVEGVRLDGKSARDLARVLDVALGVGARLGKLAVESFPQLRRLGGTVPDLRSESEAVLRGTDGEGNLLADASPELRRLRLRIARAGDRLRHMLQAYLRDPRAEDVVRDDFVTQRNGRFVIPVRTDAPRAIRGIVHGSSSSGATNFVEPMESVELNNELVELNEAEREEQDRILTAWSAAFRGRLTEVEAALEALARADALQARGRFAGACDAVTPRVADGACLRFDALRHPLLQRRLSEEGKACVPATLALAPEDRVLVLSGPNTGGKTVALKAIGLAVLAAQSGIPLPARAAELPLFGQVRADIGDHQSIEADLSTYSAHVRAVAGALRSPVPPALFLFDEIGTGTEPAEGAALARAILESLVRPGITTVATTHLGPVKAWAVTTDGASCAAMDFDPETLVPSYRIVMGVAGQSAGLDIAERLGLAGAVVSRARSLLDPRAKEGEDHLRRLREVVAEAEARAEETRREAQDLAERRDRWERRAERDSEARRRKADETLRRALEEFRRLAGKEIAAIRDPEQRARAERRRGRAERRLGAARARGRSAVAGPGSVPVPGTPVDPARLSPGDRVWVRSLGREGEVERLEGEAAEVRLGGLTTRVRVDDLRLPATEGRNARAEGSSSSVTVGSAPGGAGDDRARPRELMLVGWRVEEALAELDRFLDAARLAGHDEVRIVHGHGTGRLRAAVREFLTDHAAIRSHRPGQDYEGGDGATVAELR